MTLPKKIERWIAAGVFPQRVLLHGGADQISIALEIASKLQGESIDRIESGIQPDTVVFRDTGKSFKVDYSDAAKKDGQSEHENVRGMINWAYQRPASPYRIIILENFERASRTAPHALLKLLEEPPAQTIFLLTTTNPYQLLDTIISRVTLVRLPSVDDPDFDLDDDIQKFLRGDDLLAKFAIAESLDKQTRGGEKLDRTPVLQWLDSCIQHARSLPHLRPTLEPVLETRRNITSNHAVRFALEHLAIKLTQ